MLLLATLSKNPPHALASEFQISTPYITTAARDPSLYISRACGTFAAAHHDCNDDTDVEAAALITVTFRDMP